ncbi:MAG: hypothetical protein JW762_00235 [Dehalococcoidales bacterium]|nr:hypothetical protein [Dehalococcoidales bacterium]
MITRKKNEDKPLIYFIGLSAKPMCEHLSPGTRTGDIIETITYQLPHIDSVKTNLVRIPPIDETGRLRYPNLHEMKQGWDDLHKELIQTSPIIWVTLGQQVSSFLRMQMGVSPIKPHLPIDYSYKLQNIESGSHILSVHHPSFIYVYRRKDIEHYIDKIVCSILSTISITLKLS